MSDKPILFSGPMVRALLAGRKTQTRRVAKVKPGVSLSDITHWIDRPDGSRLAIFNRDQIAAPRIAIGDRLYVREHWRTDTAYNNTAPRELSDRVALWYEADGATIGDGVKGRFRQGMHMPRWASRITLTVTDVRVQRLQEISEADAVAEGIERSPHGNGDQWLHYPAGSSAAGWTDPRESYRSLWNSINGPGSWDANPWVAAYTFTVALGNIDSLPHADGYAYTPLGREARNG